MIIFELNEYCKILRTASAPMRIYVLFAMLVSGLACCNQRFGVEPVRGVEIEVESPDESIKISNEAFEDLDINGFIQYLKVHEKTNWSDISKEEMTVGMSRFDDNAELMELISDYYLKTGDLDNALLYNTNAENHGASSPELYKKRAKIFMARGEQGLAIDYLNKAVQLNGNDPDIYLFKGEVYLEFGDSTSALKYKEQAFTQDSSRLDIAFDLSHLHATAGGYDKSHEFIDFLINQDFRTKEANYLKAKLFRQERRDADANLLLSSMLASGETEAGARMIRYFQQRNMYDSMIFYATKVLVLDSVHTTAIAAKAVSFDKKGYFSSALMYYNQLLAIDSLNEEALAGIRKVNGKIAYLRKLREQREAIPAFDFASPKKKQTN